MSGIADKWGEAVAGRGFAQVPNYLLLLNQFLADDARLSPGELLLLVQLVGTWWQKDKLPFPSIRTLALRCGSSERQVQRSLRRLEELKLLKRITRRTQGIIASNSYDLSPLVAVLEQVAVSYPNAFPRGRTSAPPRSRAGELHFPALPPEPPLRDLILEPDQKAASGNNNGN